MIFHCLPYFSPTSAYHVSLAVTGLVQTVNQHIARLLHAKPFFRLHLWVHVTIEDKDQTKHLVMSCVQEEIHREAFQGSRRGGISYAN